MRFFIRLGCTRLFWFLSFVLLTACYSSDGPQKNSSSQNIAPTSAFTVNVDTGSAPLTVNFDTSSSSDIDGSIKTYAWDFGDGSTDVGDQVSHLYTADGKYTAILSVFDDEGYRDVSVRTINVLSNQSPISIFNVDTDIGEAPLIMNFDGSVSLDFDGSISSYFWTFGDGSNASGATVSHQYSTPGTFEVTLLVTDNGSLEDISEIRTIIVLPVNTLPTAAFTVDLSSGTTPVTVNFDATGSSDADGTITSYEWDFGDGASGQSAQTAHTYFLEGSHTVSLTITDDRGGQNTTTQTITVAGNGGVMISGDLLLSGGGTLDSDINDVNSVYQSNNTIATAQSLPSPDVLKVWGFVTKDATAIDGQRFANSNDEVDIYRVSLAMDQSINLNIKTHTDETGVENGNDLDLYLYSIADTQSPVDSSLSSGEVETITAPADGEYYIVVSAFCGKSTYTLSSALLLDTADSSQTLSQALSFNGDFVAGQVIAKLKTELLAPQDKSTQTMSAQAAIQITSLSTRNNVSMIRGHANRVSLFAINTNSKAETSQLQQQDKQDSLFDGRYGIGLSSKDRQAFEIIKTVKRLRTDSAIQYAEPNYIQQISALPNDAYYNFQWHYPAINLPQTWDITTGDASVVVAVIDTGVFMAHEDLTGNLLSTGFDFIASSSISNDGDGIDANPDDPGDNLDLSQSSWHGTHVTGTIAASSNNTTGVAGIARDIRIMPIRALGVGGGSTYDVSQSILYAAGLSNDSNTVPVQAADIINLSLGSSWFSQSQADAIKTVQDAGVIIIAAAGNNSSSEPHYPANYSGVISVAAVGMSNEQASYSNFGPEIDLVAPGGDNSIDGNNDGQLDTTIVSTFVNTYTGSRQSGYAAYQGTSMATPHVTGVVALMKSVYPELSPVLLNKLIANGSITIDLSGDGANTRNDTYGYGMIDALKAVQQAQALATGATPPTYDEISIRKEIDTMASATQQTISITKLSGSYSVASIQLSFPWATLTPLGVDTDGNGVIDGDGMGDYQLDIDRGSLIEDLYILDIIFIMDNGDEYSTQVNVSDSVTEQLNVGTVYLLLLEATTRNVIVQKQIILDSSTVPFSIDSIPDGNYVIFAGTDFDGDRKIESNELFGADGGTSTPTVHSVIGNDISGVSLSIGSTSGDPIDLIN